MIYEDLHLSFYALRWILIIQRTKTLVPGDSQTITVRFRPDSYVSFPQNYDLKWARK